MLEAKQAHRPYKVWGQPTYKPETEILKHSTIQAAKLSIDLIQIQELFASKGSKKHHCNWYPGTILDLENDPNFFFQKKPPECFLRYSLDISFYTEYRILTDFFLEKN